MNLENGQRSLLAQLFLALIGDEIDMRPERIGLEAQRLLTWIQRVKYKVMAMQLPNVGDVVELFQILVSLFQAVGRPGTSGDVTSVTVELPEEPDPFADK